MNFYTLASKMQKSLRKEEDRLENLGWSQDDAREAARQFEINKFEANCRLGIELMMRYKEIAYDMGLTDVKPVKQCFMITIRPECNKIKFEDFYNRIIEFVNRKMFKEFKLSFEQKGTTNDTLGYGFHVHIIAHTTCRSKAEVLRNTINTWKDVCAPNCIQVDLCKNPDEVVEKYLINYESNDKHKITTKEWDTKWREKYNLRPVYNDGKELCVPYQVRSGTQIIEIN